MSAATNEQEAAEAVLAWVQEVNPELVGGYNYAVAEKPLGLPDVVVEVSLATTSVGDERFPYSQLQQTLLRIFDLTVSIMVSNDDPESAAAFLRLCSQRCHEQAIADATLGGRVFVTSQQIESNFVPQFTEYDDGTRGRQVQIVLSVAHMIEHP